MHKEHNEFDTSGYDTSFEESSFWDILDRNLRRLGHQIIEKVFLAYYVAIDPATPPWARTALCGALGYFVLPMDAVPDFVPVVGFADDASVLAAALVAVAVCVTGDHFAQAREQMRRWGFKFEGDGPDDGEAPVNMAAAA